jgi:ABC-2 type transport system ATP-binding protein
VSNAPIAVRDVVKTFSAAKPALDGASFVVAQGQRTCLLGPNGAGKTTLIRILIGALAPTRGEVLLYGVRPHAPEWMAARQRVGVVPQLPGMYRDLSGREYLRLVQGVYGRGEPFKVAKRLGLTARMLDKSMAELSGGWQRRLTLAAAILSEPELIILDEPTVGLDPVAAREVIDILRDTMRGRTTLLCTHNLVEAEQLCDAVVILRAGKVLLSETIRDLRESAPARASIGALEGVAAVRAALQSLGHTELTDDGRVVSFFVRNREQTISALLKELLSMQLSIYECVAQPPTLEDLFLSAVAQGPAEPESLRSEVP